jgi:hypothetical protein
MTNFFAILFFTQRAMRTHDLMMPKPKREQIQKITEAQVIILFIPHFKEKFLEKIFLSFQQS